MIRQPIRRGTCPKVSLSYVDGEGDFSTRTVAPLAIITSGQGRNTSNTVYLEARCTVVKATRTFRMDRIESISDLQTGEVYEKLAWVRELQLSNPSPYTFDFGATDEPALEPNEEAARETEAAPEPKRHVPLRAIMWSASVGYLLGRTRLLGAMAAYFQQHGGVWL